MLPRLSGGAGLPEGRTLLTSNGIVQKLWKYSNVLRDDGLSYLD